MSGANSLATTWPSLEEIKAQAAAEASTRKPPKLDPDMATFVKITRAQDETINSFIAGALPVLQWAESAEAELSEGGKTVFDNYSQACDKLRDEHLGFQNSLQKANPVLYQLAFDKGLKQAIETDGLEEVYQKLVQDRENKDLL